MQYSVSRYRKWLQCSAALIGVPSPVTVRDGAGRLLHALLVVMAPPRAGLLLWM